MSTTTDTRPTTNTTRTDRDEDLLHSSQSAHFHARPQAVRFPGDLDDDERARVQGHFDDGGFEPVPVQVTARNRQNQPLRVRSAWDGTQLHLDIHGTAAPVLAVRPALAAMVRYYRDHPLKLAALLVGALAVLGALTLGLAGVL
jgi:hypothetical protein